MNMIKIIYHDRDIVVCIKPAGILSTDEPGGMSELIQNELDIRQQIYVVHRLDRAVSGLMVYALNKKSASNLSRQITDKTFGKGYLAVIHGQMDENKGRLDDLLFRDVSKNKTYPVKRMRKGVREASLEYEVLKKTETASLVWIKLITGRTHQIRAQFSGRHHPLFGDKRYGAAGDYCEIALWSYSLVFSHPRSGEKIAFKELPPDNFPWNCFFQNLK